MSANRIVSWAAVLLICTPALAHAQSPNEPEYGVDDAPKKKKAASGGEVDPDEDEDDGSSEEDDGDDDSDDSGTESTTASDDAPEGKPEAVAPASADGAEGDENDEDDEDDEEDEVEVIKTVEKEVNIVKTGSRSRIGSDWNASQAEKDGRNYLWFLDIGGYIRAGYTGIQDDPDGRFGNHDGFLLGNARLTLKGQMKSLGFKFQLEGATTDREDAPNDPNGEVVVRLRDANIFWQPIQPLRITIGQFKPPFEVEEEFSTSEILFADRSVGSRGVKNIEGRNVNGLSRNREVGLNIGTDHWHFGAEEGEREGFGISYNAALTNGQNANSALNDNDKLAFYGRGELHWADLVTAGGAYFLNDRTIGVEPDTIDENRSGWTADLTLTAFDVTLIGSVIGETVTRPDLAGVEPETSGLAYQGQIAYKTIFGLQPAFRYAFFDPTEDATSDDALTYLTAGLNWVPDYPVKLQLNYTIAMETEEFAIPNNRFDGVLQVTW